MYSEFAVVKQTEIIDFVFMFMVLIHFQVQQFKQDPKPSACLHSVFNAHTGDEVFSHNEYGHLQVKRVCTCVNESLDDL